MIILYKTIFKQLKHKSLFKTILIQKVGMIIIISLFSLFVYINIVVRTSNTVLIHYYQNVLYNLTSTFDYTLGENFWENPTENSIAYREIKKYIMEFGQNLGIQDVYLSSYNEKTNEEIFLIHSTRTDIKIGDPVESIFGENSYKSKQMISGHLKNQDGYGYYSFYSPILNEYGNTLALIAFNIPDYEFLNLTFSSLIKTIIKLLIVNFFLITLYLHIITIGLWNILKPIYIIKNQVENISNRIFSINKNIIFNTHEFNVIQKLFFKSITLIKDFILYLIIYLEYIRFSISKVKLSSLEIINKIKQATSSITKISNSSNEVNEKVIILKENMSVISTDITDINNNIKNILDLNIKASNICQINADNLNEFLIEISILVKKFKAEQLEVENLTTLSNEINEILENILTITNETKLLSLNASIVAISAGEHGKSFGVIAKQVGDLSQNIIKSANYIQQTLVKITDSIEKLNSDSIEIFRLFKNHSDKSKIFSINLNEIYNSIRNITTFLKDLYLYSENLNFKNEIIIDNIQFLSSNSSYNLNSINQIAKLITQVNENALMFRNSFENLDIDINKIKFELSEFKL